MATNKRLPVIEEMHAWRKEIDEWRKEKGTILKERDMMRQEISILKAEVASLRDRPSCKEGEIVEVKEAMKEELTNTIIEAIEIKTKAMADSIEENLGAKDEGWVEDSIVGKCKVVCISKDPRNKEPSVSHVEDADFVFSHAYDVDLKHTFPVEVVADKLGPDAIFNTEEWLLAVTKIEGKTNEFKPKKSIQSSPSESKKRPRDAEGITYLQKRKIDKQDDLKKGRISSQETIQKKKVKVSDGKAPALKEKARDGSISKQEALVHSQRQLLKSDAVSRLSKARIPDVKEPGLTEGAVLNKSSTPGEISVDIDEIMEQTDSIINNIVRQVDNETVLRETSKGGDTQELENRAGNSLKVAKAQAEGREAADHKAQLADIKQLDSEKMLMEPDFSWMEDRNKESMLKLSKSSLNREPFKPFEKRKIFKELPWEENLQRGIPQGKVLRLQNIDPLLTSADIRVSDLLAFAEAGFKLALSNDYLI
ncbi:hypothetical protein L7F22_005289 [Adiantum nelumboides]|nr:hypothetical protein [Adiantum nelumboides]